MSLLSITRKKDKSGKGEEASALPTEVDKDEIFISDAAADQIPLFADKEGLPGGLLRIGIKGGGCSGLSYHFAIDAVPKDSDHIFGDGTSKVCVDPKSMNILGGTILDYLTELGRAEFVMRNPNAKSTCSCGQSFSI